MRLENADCLDVIKTIPNNSIDCVITDCPYHIVAGGVSVKRLDELPKGCLRRFKADNTSCSAKWIKEDDSYISACRKGKMFEYNEIKFEEWLPEVYRVLKEGTHCYIMINSRNLKELQEKAENVGFKFVNLLVWRKQNATPSQFYMQQCEFILLLRKGGARAINNKGTMNCFDILNIIGDKLHPTEKPVNLMKIFVENSTDKGEIVLDPFMGSGSTGVACKELGRDFIGIEIDKAFYDVAYRRIENKEDIYSLEGQPSLFGEEDM